MPKETPCWIRGQMGPADLQNDPVRQATQNCRYRIQGGLSLWGGYDHTCTHPAVTREYEEIQHTPGGGTMAGGVSGYATFCEAIDLHLTTLGEKSRLIIDGTYRVKGDEKLLPPGDKSSE